MEDNEQYGPALPPGMVAGNSRGEIKTEDRSASHTKVIGPAHPVNMPKSTDSDELSNEGQLIVKDERTVGPMPSEMAQEDVVDAADEFERRSKRMKDKLTVKAEAEEGPVKREEWMTELPPEMGKNFTMQKRNFSKNAGQSDDKDRSSWTDAPGVKKEKDSRGKKRKRDEEKAGSLQDHKLHQQVEEYNKNNRSESLMDMHANLQKKKKKKKKKEKKKKKRTKGEKEEKEKEVRKTFDRDKDLNASQFDDAQRKSIIKRSEVLNTRFSFGGSTSHFL